MIPTSNPFKEALKAGKPQIGFWLMLATRMPPRSARAAASTGC
jgi:2-keto-3-deoxy-L-rhamnonate aldolase RhmA